jgi:hypothetical protein
MDSLVCHFILSRQKLLPNSHEVFTSDLRTSCAKNAHLAHILPLLLNIFTMASFTPKPMAITRLIPKIENKGNRLNWIDYKQDDETSYKWPAIICADLEEFQDMVQNEADDDLKTKICLALFENYDKESVMVARLLGRSEFLILEEGTAFHGYATLLFDKLAKATPQYFAKHLDLYLDYMSALDASYDWLKDDGTKSDKNRKKGEELLAKYHRSNDESLEENKPHEAEEQEKSSLEEKAPERTSPVTTTAETTSSPPASFTNEEEQTISDDRSVQCSDEHPGSSSATVVSMSDSSDAPSTTEPEEATTPEEEQRLEILKDDTFKDIRNKLIFAGWEVRKATGEELLYFPVPNASVETGSRGNDSFDESELRKYLEESYQWTEPVKTEEEQLAEAQEEPIKMEDEPAEPRKKRGRTKKPGLPNFTKEPKAKKPKVERVNTPKQEPARQFTRAGLRNKSGNTDGKTEKTPVEKEIDPFYNFTRLISLLHKKMGWKYRFARKMGHSHVYEKPDTLGEKAGTYLEDFFYEEQEVIDYCKKHKYKQKYGHLESVPASARKTKQTKGETPAKPDPMFITPPPKKFPRYAR